MIEIIGAHTCEKCQWWKKAPNNLERRGSCRRHAPTVAQMMTPQGPVLGTVFPETGSEDMCGDWERKE